MTLQTQHLAYLPAVRRHQRRMRILQNHKKKVDEMRSSESEWSQTPAAGRNRELISKWEEAIGKLQKNNLCAKAALFDKKLIESYMHFNSMAAKLQMRGII